MFARLLFLSLFLPLALHAAPAAAQAGQNKLEVSVKRADSGGDKVFEVNAQGTVRASPQQVWKVLTDYERMVDFVPDLETSKVISRTGRKTIIEQFGEARFLFFSRSIHLIVQASEEPMTSIDISLVTGDMKQYACRWEMIPVPETGGTRIVY